MTFTEADEEEEASRVNTPADGERGGHGRSNLPR